MYTIQRTVKKATFKLDYERDRKILADVDGVLLDWESGYDAWMAERGYTISDSKNYKQSIRYGLEQDVSDALVKQFNESAWMGFLKPLRDSVEVLDKLAAEHWHIECITSLSTDYWAGKLREMNLENWFGRQSIRRVRCLETGADKDEILKEYKHSHFWIEDKPENAIAGLNAGHKPILMDWPHNREFDHPDVFRAQNWAEIYTHIKNS